ncbi:hypothetical protein B0H14DRAFT_2921240 [Mycena olivaceomarginata]|nr:hypothetical protein B0H14DRAFT_2921240 [Mycena olivaceomarginata]
MSIVLNAVGNSYIATEDCMPWSNRDNDPQCQKNQCGLSQYGKLPYISDRAWELMKTHLSTVGPVSLGVVINDSFSRYATSVAGDSSDKVFYDGHPDYQKSTCAYGGHAMTIVGYSHFTKPGESKKTTVRLGSSDTDSYGVKVREGSPFFNKLALPGDLIG